MKAHPPPPKRGRVYATLPTQVTLPFGLHVNADWLLNISRGGLRELEDNPWQRSIANGIVDILAQFLQWCSEVLMEPHAVKAAFQALSLPSPEAGGLETLLAQDDWLSRLRLRLAEGAVIPAWKTDPGAMAFVKPRDAIVPPDPLAKAFAGDPDLQPSVLLNGSVLRSDVLGSGATELLRRLDLLSKMRPQDLAHAWAGGLEDWWTALPDDDEIRRDLLFHVWAAVAKLTSVDAWKQVRLPLRAIGSRAVAAGDRDDVSQGRAPRGRRSRRAGDPQVPAIRHPRRQPFGSRMGFGTPPAETERADSCAVHSSLGLGPAPRPRHRSTGHREGRAGGFGIIGRSGLVAAPATRALGQA